MSGDYYMRQMEGMANALSQLLLGKQSSQQEDKSYEYVVSLSDRQLQTDLYLLVLQGDVNQAEDLLFEKMQASLEPEYLATAQLFYQWLRQMDTKLLERCGYMPEEIDEGWCDAKRLYGRE